MSPTPRHSEASPTRAAIAYLLPPLTGLFMYFSPGRDRDLRWNSLQSIALGVIALIVSFVLALLSVVFFASSYLDGMGPPWWLEYGGLGGWAAAGFLLLGWTCGVLTARGKPLHLPLLGRFADRYA